MASPKLFRNTSREIAPLTVQAQDQREFYKASGLSTSPIWRLRRPIKQEIRNDAPWST
jgi:hypothetical protein